MKWQIKYYVARTSLSGEFMSEVVCTWDHYFKKYGQKGLKSGPGGQLS
jgi:hypothetical protein